MLKQKNSWRRVAAPLAALVLSGTALTVAVAAPAAAATCSGSEIDRKTVKSSSGTPWADLIVYYSSSSQKNCALLTNRTSSARSMSVMISRCRKGTGGSGQTFCTPIESVSDSGTFSSYAGPVITPPAEGYCILVEGYIKVGSVEKYPEIQGHCG
jgi:hypothetical protein